MVTLMKAQWNSQINVEALDAQFLLADKSILPIQQEGEMYFLDVNKNEKLFLKGFDIAYPFFKSGALIKLDGKYGIIDRNGKFLIQPTYKTFELAPFPEECHIVIFEDLAFDLKTGTASNNYLKNEEPSPPKLQIFKGENGKYGIKNKEKVKIAPAYDDIIAINPKFILVVEKEKIGFIDLLGNVLVDPIFEKAYYSEKYPHYIYPIIALKKGRQWHYFKDGEKILESRFASTRFDISLPNAIGVFLKRKRSKVLFKNGSTSKKSYDFIAKNGLVAQRKNKIYLLKSNGEEHLYHRTY